VPFRADRRAARRLPASRLPSPPPAVAAARHRPAVHRPAVARAQQPGLAVPITRPSVAASTGRPLCPPSCRRRCPPSGRRPGPAAWPRPSRPPGRRRNSAARRPSSRWWPQVKMGPRPTGSEEAGLRATISWPAGGAGLETEVQETPSSTPSCATCGGGGQWAGRHRRPRTMIRGPSPTGRDRPQPAGPGATTRQRRRRLLELARVSSRLAGR